MPYVCSKCRGGQVVVNTARPSIDERFAIGFCATCERERTLIVDDTKAQQQMDTRDEEARQRRLVSRVRSGRVPAGPKGEAMVAEAREITERWHQRLHGSK